MSDPTWSEVFLTSICEYIEAYEDKHQPYTYLDASDPGEVYDNTTQAALVWESSLDDIDRQIMVRLYEVADDQSISDSVQGVQFKITGPADMRFITAAIDDLFDLFHGMQTTTIGGVKVVMAERRSGASLGQDGSGRVSRSQNYYFTVHRPSRNRT